jgi:hypothetical protein
MYFDGSPPFDNYAVTDCPNLTGVYFAGNNYELPTDSSIFSGDNKATVYYLPDTTGWFNMYGPTFDGRPATLWLPQIGGGSSVGVQTNQFGFAINWASGQTIMVEAATNLANPSWQPLQTNILTNGSFYFGDPQWTNYPARFYRLSTP